MALETIDLLASDISVGDQGHDTMHDYIHVGLKDLKSALLTLDGAAVKITGNQTVNGIKTFASSPVVPTPTTDFQAATKKYIDDGLATKTNTGHTHTIANITSLQATLDTKEPTIASGTTGQYYRGDKTWQALNKAAVGVKEFGDILATYNTAVGFTTLDWSVDGNYIVGSLVTDMPATGQTWNVTILSSSVEAGIIAIAIRSGSNTPYLRVKASTGTWGSWQSISGGYSSMSQSEGNTGTATSQRVITALDLKAIIQTHAQAQIASGVVTTTGDQTIGGVKTFSSAPRLTPSSTSGYAWIATDSAGNGAWSAVVNAPGGTVPWSNITGRPSTFPPEAHVHAITDVTNLSTTLSGKVDTTRTITAGTGLTGGGDLSANRTLAVTYGTAAGTAAQGNDSRLSDKRIPVDGSVGTTQMADGGTTVAKLATTARAYDICFTQSVGTRKVGNGEVPLGIRISRSVTFTQVLFRFETADVSGTSQVQVRKNGVAVYTATMAQGGLAVVATGSVSFVDGDILTVYISTVGTTPGKGLVADLLGYLS